MIRLQNHVRHAVWHITALVALVLGFVATLATPANAAAASFAAQNGMVVLEAEQFDSNQNRGGTSWSSTNDGSALLANPADGYYRAGTSAAANYPVNISTGGTYYFWVRARAASTGHNSLYAGLDGSLVGMHIAATNQWTWSREAVENAGRAKADLASGTHTLTLGIREGGVQIDRVLLTNDANYVPTGTGPAATSRGSAPATTPTAAVSATAAPTSTGHDHAAPTAAPTSTGHDHAAPTALPTAGNGANATPVPATTNGGVLPALSTTGHPMGCRTGEMFVDSQDWWLNSDGGPGQDFGHLHTQVCFPWQKTLRGSLTLTVRSVIHMTPGIFRELQVQMYQGDAANIIGYQRNFTRSLDKCTETGGTLKDAMTCMWTDTVTVDTSRARYDGEVQFRVRGFVRETDGKDMRTSTSLHAYLNNGGRATYDKLYEDVDNLEGRGWYTDINYARANLHDATRILKPVSGVWQPNVFIGHGAEGRKGESWYAAIDTDFHNNKPGLEICPKDTQIFRGHPVCGKGEYNGPLRIDTTKLANGWHRLFLKADQPTDNGSIHSGVLATYFLVQN